MQNLDSALFLDRDGVINRRIVGGYVLSLSQLELLPGVVDAIARLGRVFRHVIVVTNQQGVGKGLMSAADLHEIHGHIIRQVQTAGGYISKVYCCTSLATAGDPNRKPDIGMGLQAKRDFPDIDFGRSLMVGDSPSDMLFAERLGMQSIFIAHDRPAPRGVRHVCDSLAELPEILASPMIF